MLRKALKRGVAPALAPARAPEPQSPLLPSPKPHAVFPEGRSKRLQKNGHVEINKTQPGEWRKRFEFSNKKFSRQDRRGELDFLRRIISRWSEAPPSWPRACAERRMIARTSFHGEGE